MSGMGFAILLGGPGLHNCSYNPLIRPQSRVSQAMTGLQVEVTSSYDVTMQRPHPCKVVHDLDRSIGFGSFQKSVACSI